MTPLHPVADAIGALNLLLATCWLVKAVGAIRGAPTLPDLTLRAMPLPDLDRTQGPDVTGSLTRADGVTAARHIAVHGPYLGPCRSIRVELS
jgi:hypothetical protein